MRVYFVFIVFYCFCSIRSMVCMWEGFSLFLIMIDIGEGRVDRGIRVRVYSIL